MGTDGRSVIPHAARSQQQACRSHSLLAYLQSVRGIKFNACRRTTRTSRRERGDHPVEDMSFFYASPARTTRRLPTYDSFSQVCTDHEAKNTSYICTALTPKARSKRAALPRKEIVNFSTEACRSPKENPKEPASPVTTVHYCAAKSPQANCTDSVLRPHATANNSAFMQAQSEDGISVPGFRPVCMYSRREVSTSTDIHIYTYLSSRTERCRYVDNGWLAC